MKLPVSKVQPHSEPCVECDERREHDHKYNPLKHDAFNCPFCTHEQRILQALIIQQGTLQKLLTKFEESNGLPHGTAFSFSQANPAQNTNYTSPGFPLAGKIKSLMIAGNGNVTLTMTNRYNSRLGGLTICTMPCNGGAVAVPHQFLVEVNGGFTLSTDSSSGTGLLAVSAWIEPVAMYPEEMYRLHAGRGQ